MEGFMTVSEVAAALKVKPMRIYSTHYRRSLPEPTQRAGMARMYSPAEVERFRVYFAELDARKGGRRGSVYGSDEKQAS